MNSRVRETSKYTKLGYSEFSSIEDLTAVPLASGLNSMLLDGKWFDFYYEHRDAPVTLVAFSAAMPARLRTFPIFSGRNLLKDLDVNLLTFYDPACGNEESLPTFWHLGTKQVESTRFIPRIIDHALSSSPGAKLIFFGSSAGGFAALNYSSHFENSVAFVMNPRVNILNAPKRFGKYVEVAFPGEDKVHVARSLPYNQAKNYELPKGNRVVYLQNMQDKDYRLHHYNHFLKAVGGREDVEFVTGRWGEGHVVPPRGLYMGLLQKVVEGHAILGVPRKSAV